MADNQKKSTKTFAVITYAIILVCLLAGLLLPPNFFQGDYNAVVWQIPHALKCVGVDWAKGAELVNPYTITLWGGEAFEIGGLFLLLFALVCVVALVTLFIVLFGNKEKNTSLKSAKFIAVISTIVLSVLLSMQMATFSLMSGYELGGSWNIPLLIAFGGSLVMLFVQSIYEKGGSGFVKTLLTIFSLLTIVLCLFSFAAIVPQLADALKDLLKDNAQILAWTTETGEPLGSIWYHLSVPFFENYGDFVGKLGSWDKSVISICMLLLGVLILVNFFLDVCGLAKQTNRKMIIANLIRYGVEVLLALAVLIIGKLVSGYEIGLICYALIALAVLPVVINIFRLLAFKEKKEDKKATQKSEAAATDAYEPAPQPADAQPAPAVADKPAQPAPVAQNTPAQPATQPQAQTQQPHAKQQAAAPVASQNEKVYAPVIYSGPRDEFIDTLSNEQKIEFSRVFLEHRNGNIQGVPDYVLEGENEKFFKSLFIYYARVRGLVSDGLMNKFYEKVSALNGN
ncbi:MAG: hypothetical protein J1G05_00555 [Clostridiales bacterium]|nr:hypothetical protein [Clostridiales bacterium]